MSHVNEKVVDITWKNSDILVNMLQSRCYYFKINQSIS